MALDTPKPPHSSVPDLNSVAWQRYFLSLGQYLTTQYIQQTQINQQFNAIAGSGMMGVGEGEAGQDGLPGIQGPQGVQGIQGIPGMAGEDGQTADDSFNLLGLPGITMVGGGTGIVGPTTFDVFNTISTTVNAFGAATTVNIGAATGTCKINNAQLKLGDGVDVSSGWLLYLSKPSGQTVIASDSYGQEAVYLARRAGGTDISPSALTTDAMMLNVAARGYHSGGAFTTLSRVGMQFYAAENWTSTAQGTHIDWYTTLNGTNVATTRATLHNDGTLILGLSGSAPLTNTATAGILQVNGWMSILDSNLPTLRFFRAGTVQAYWGISDGTALVSAAAAGDTILRAQQALWLRGGGDTGGISISSTGLLSCANNISINVGTVSAPSLYWGTDTGTGPYRIGSNNIGFAVGGSKVLGVASTGLSITGSLAATTSILSSGAISGIGYATGAGGSVSQGSGSGKATGVTLAKVCGTITMDGANLNADTTVTFLLTMTGFTLNPQDQLKIDHISVGTFGAYTFNSRYASSTTMNIDVRNITPSNLAEAIVIQYSLIRSVAS